LNAFPNYFSHFSIVIMIDLKIFVKKKINAYVS